MEKSHEQNMEELKQNFMKALQEQFTITRVENEDAYIISVNFTVPRQDLAYVAPDALYDSMHEQLKEHWKQICSKMKYAIGKQ